MSRLDLQPSDAFDLPDWLGTSDLVWHSTTGLRSGHDVSGELICESTDQQHPCDLLAVDDAFPEPVVSEQFRVLVHRAWRHGQVQLAWAGDRLVVAMPGVRIDAGRVMESMSRLARAVGASPERWSVRLRIGEHQGHTPID